jgi:hypothetical protein
MFEADVFIHGNITQKSIRRQIVQHYIYNIATKKWVHKKIGDFKVEFLGEFESIRKKALTSI